MSCYLITYDAVDKKKKATPVNTEKEYRSLRDSEQNTRNTALARQGDEKAKRCLVQFNYNSHHPSEMLKGDSLLSDTFAFDYDDPETRESFIEKALEHQFYLELMMLERSTKGAHAVFKRRKGESILEAQYRVAKALGVEFDNGCKDMNRVMFSTTASAEDLVYLDPTLFNNIYDEAVCRQETEAVKERVKNGEERVPKELLAANKHANCDVKKNAEKMNDEKMNDVEMKAEKMNDEKMNDEKMKSETMKDVEMKAETMNADKMKSEMTNDVKMKAETMNDGTMKAETVCEGSICSALPKWARDEVKAEQFIRGVFHLCGTDIEDVLEGTRNTTIYNVASKLRHLCDFNLQSMMALLYPKYTFGLEKSEVESCLKSAIQRERGFMPNDLRTLFDNLFGKGKKQRQGENLQDESLGHPDDVFIKAYPAMNNVVADEALIPRSNKPIETIIRIAPLGYKQPVLAAITPALATLMTNVTMKFASKDVKRLNCWTHLDGMPSSNKKLMMPPIDEIMHEVKLIDERNNDIMNAAIRKKELNKNKEEQEAIPSLPLVMAAADTTRKKHIQMMKANQGAHTYTVVEELDSLKTQSPGYYYRGDFERYMFDNGEVGSATAMNDSENITTHVAWNLTTSGTREQAYRHWRSATDGGVTRVWFELMPGNFFEKMPDYKQYTDEEKAYIHRTSLTLLKLHGLMLTPKLDKFMLKWVDEERLRCEQACDVVRATFMKRVADIAHTFCGVLNGCSIAQQIMEREDQFACDIEAQQTLVAQLTGEQQREAQKRLEELEKQRDEFDNSKYDVSQYHEDKQNLQMVKCMVDKILDHAVLLWADKFRKQLASAFSCSKQPTKTSNVIADMPTEFTIDTAINLHPEMTVSALKKMFQRQCQQGSLIRITTENRKVVYRKATAA